MSTRPSTSPRGVAISDHRTHNYVRVFGNEFRHSPHYDWSAFSDWSVTGDFNTGTPLTDKIFRQNFRVADSQTDVTYTFARFNSRPDQDREDSCAYHALPRPTQSPDGTKVMFNSTFLERTHTVVDECQCGSQTTQWCIDQGRPLYTGQTDRDVGLFWAVAYYPYPPEIRGCQVFS